MRKKNNKKQNYTDRQKRQNQNEKDGEKPAPSKAKEW